MYNGGQKTGNGYPGPTRGHLACNDLIQLVQKVHPNSQKDYFKTINAEVNVFATSTA